MLRDIFGVDFKADFLVLNEKEIAKTESLLTYQQPEPCCVNFLNARAKDNNRMYYG